MLAHLVLKNLEQISFVDSLDSPGVQLSPHTCWQPGVFQREAFSMVNACWWNYNLLKHISLTKVLIWKNQGWNGIPGQNHRAGFPTVASLTPGLGQIVWSYRYAWFAAQMCKIRFHPTSVMMRNEHFYLQFQVPTVIASFFSIYLSAYLHAPYVCGFGVPATCIGACGTKPASSDAMHYATVIQKATTARELTTLTKYPQWCLEYQRI